MSILCLHLFSTAAITNSHRLNGIKQHIYYSSVEVQHGSYWAKIKVLAGLLSFVEAPEKNPFSCFLQLLEASGSPWLMAFFYLQSQKWPFTSSSHHISDTLLPSFSTVKDLWDSTGPMQIISLS